MSIQFICKPEFFHSRLSPQLGLNGNIVEPGTTYFLCTDITEVPALVSSQDPLSLTALSKGGKVQIFICKEKPIDGNISTQPVVLGTRSVTNVPALTKVSKSASDGNQNVECLKAENICHVTSSSDLPSIKEKDKKSEVAALSLAQAPVIQVPMYTINSVNSGIPVSNITCPQGVLTSAPFSQQSSQGTSVLTGSCSSDLPCQALRHGLKQAILQRRKDLGKNMIDLVKEECDRQVTLQNIQLTKDEMQKRLKRRESNNRAARKCREKRRIQELTMRKELGRLTEHKNKLKELVSTLERQQRFLRLWASGVRKIDEKGSKEMIQSILNSEIVIPEYHSNLEQLMEDDYENSIVISSSEYNSDDTRNGFELDSGQDTNDCYDAAVGYTEMTVEEVDEAVSDSIKEEKVDEAVSDNIKEEKEESMFKAIKNQNIDLETNSDNDSDVELIELDKPLVIDVN